LVQQKSDPAFNSAEGYETGHSQPCKDCDQDIVKYKTDLPYDADVTSTQAHYKAQEADRGGQFNFDPEPFQQPFKSEEQYRYSAAQRDVANNDASQSLADLLPQREPSQQATNAIVQEKSKTAVKSASRTSEKVEAKSRTAMKTQTKAEKMQSFQAMRKKMMSNWGTK